MNSIFPEYFSYIPFFFVGMVLLMAFLIVPTVASFTKRKQEEAMNMLPNLARKMGLQAKSNGVVGYYKGYHVEITMGLSTNHSKVYAAMKSGEPSKMYGKQTFSPRLEVILTAESGDFPTLAFFQSMTWLRTDQKVQDLILEREPTLPKLNLPSKPKHKVIQKMQVYGYDAFTASKILENTTLQKLLDTWVYPDIQLQGNEIRLLLDNNNLLNEMGNRLSKNDYIMQAADICVAIANAAKVHH